MYAFKNIQLSASLTAVSKTAAYKLLFVGIISLKFGAMRFNFKFGAMRSHQLHLLAN